MEEWKLRESSVTLYIVRLSEPSEMCIFHMLYYTDPDFDTNDNYKYGDCTDDQYIPADGEDLLPPNPVLQEHASHGNRTGKVYFTDKLFINLVLGYHINQIYVRLRC